MNDPGDEHSDPVHIDPVSDRIHDFANNFRHQANALAMAYGGPMYLVGSMLKRVDPGDVDLRIMLERDQLEMWFGEGFDDPWWQKPAKLRLEREQLKQSVRLSRRWRGYPARRYDFQFQCVLLGDNGLPISTPSRGPVLRLDDIPLSTFRAGWTDP